MKCCDNCNKVMKDDCSSQSFLFYRTCSQCTPTCSECGQDCGFLKRGSDVVDDTECQFCNKMCCKSCGINIECQKCGIIACEHCISEHAEVCNCLKRKLELIEKMRMK